VFSIAASFLRTMETAVCKKVLAAIYMAIQKPLKVSVINVCSLSIPITDPATSIDNAGST